MFKKYDYYINQLLDKEYDVERKYDPNLFVNSDIG